MKKLLSLLGVLSFLVSLSAKANLCESEEGIQKTAALGEEDFTRFLAEGKKIDQILVSKKYRRVYLLREDQVVRSYRAAFGDPRGPKRFEGDFKTPEGVYYISQKNPKSAFYLSLQISYPNEDDVAYALSQGRSPGGNIMIHGLPTDPLLHRIFALQHPVDWTRGCVAVTDAQIREIYKLTPIKTPITICPLP